MWLLALRSAAGAQGAPGSPAVSIEVDACAKLEQSTFDHLADIEFGEMLRQPDDTPFVTRVHVGCDKEGRIQLRVGDAITGKESTRTLSSAAIPDRTRERLVVLAVYELVTSSWVELELYPEPAIPSASPAVPRPMKEAARQTVRRVPERSPVHEWELGVGAFSRIYPSGVLSTQGGALHVEHLPSYWLGWKVEADVGGGVSTEDAVGRIRALDASGAAFLLAYGAGARVRFDIALGLRVGAWRMRGSPQGDAGFTGRTLSVAWFGPAAAAGLALYPARRVGIRMDFEAGVLTRRADFTTEDGSNLLRLQGVWFRPALKVQVRL
jgi:hypothetical protein